MDNTDYTDNKPISRRSSSTSSIGFISSFFGRSISENSYDDEHHGRTRLERSRTFSESSADNDNEIDSDLRRDARANTIAEAPESSSFASSSASSNSPVKRKTSLTISAMQIFGAKLIQPSERKNSSPVNPMLINNENNGGEDEEDGASLSTTMTKLSQVEAIKQDVSQNDHMNQRLLGSFLSRINNVAANLVDPAGVGERGQVYTDDPMMDRVLKQVENSKIE